MEYSGLHIVIGCWEHVGGNSEKTLAKVVGNLFAGCCDVANSIVHSLLTFEGQNRAPHLVARVKVHGYG